MLCGNLPDTHSSPCGHQTRLCIACVCCPLLRLLPGAVPAYKPPLPTYGAQGLGKTLQAVAFCAALLGKSGGRDDMLPRQFPPDFDARVRL